MSICPKNKSSKARRDKRRANWKMSAPNLVKCSKCGELMMPHRVCRCYQSSGNQYRRESFLPELVEIYTYIKQEAENRFVNTDLQPLFYW